MDLQETQETQETPTKNIVKVGDENIEALLDKLYKMRDANHKHKYLIVNKAFNEEFKPYLIKEDALKWKAVLESVAWFTYIVSPFWKDQTVPQALTSQIDINKIASVNSVYEDETVYIEDFLFWTETYKW